MENFNDPTDYMDVEEVSPEEEVSSGVIVPPVEAEVRKLTIIFNSVSDLARIKFLEKLVKHSSKNVKLMLDKLEKGLI
jgi:hypothetical protein